MDFPLGIQVRDTVTDESAVRIVAFTVNTPPAGFAARVASAVRRLSGR